MNYHRIATLQTAEKFDSHLNHLGIAIPFDQALELGPTAPLAQAYTLRSGFTIGNRFCILPMEGWDGTTDGRPTELVTRRWRNFGLSGAKLIWGGEAAAVRPDGRANPNQLIIHAATLPDIAALRQALVDEHQAHFGRSDDLLVGLQLTHSGRFCRPNDKKRMAPRILYHHPILDRKFGLPPDYPLLTDGEIDDLIGDYVAAARLAQEAGFTFVDVKHCHGYLGHEFLSAVDRPGRYGGSFANRTRFLREVVQGIRTHVPGMQIGVRLSGFDFVPFRPGAEGVGEPEPVEMPYRYAFGGDGTGVGIDYTEPFAFLDLLAELEIELVCLSGGSPYYVPHIQRPALFPPSDGYRPPEDPLVGVARQIAFTAAMKRHRPDLLIVASALTYLQEWLPLVGQAMLRQGMADFIGLGRMVLSYPQLPADVLAGRALQRKRLCRTFSDCTTAPRNGLVSGCYPLDPFYKDRPEAETLTQIKGKE